MAPFRVIHNWALVYIKALLQTTQKWPLDILRPGNVHYAFRGNVHYAFCLKIYGNTLMVILNRKDILKNIRVVSLVTLMYGPKIEIQQIVYWRSDRLK